MRKIKIGLLLAAVLACGCQSTQEGAGKLPDVALPRLTSGSAPSLSSCPTAKCLTVYLAPWCGYCRAATPLIIQARDYLKQRGVETRIIVGMDRPQALEEYARIFGPDTLLDAKGTVPLDGVPHFYVSNASGEILKDMGGLPAGVTRPESLASIFDLP